MRAKRQLAALPLRMAALPLRKTALKMLGLQIVSPMFLANSKPRKKKSPSREAGEAGGGPSREAGEAGGGPSREAGEAGGEAGGGSQEKRTRQSREGGEAACR